MQVCLYSLCFSHFLFIRDSGRRDIYPFRKTNNSIPWDEVFETLKKGNRIDEAHPFFGHNFCD